MKKIIIAIVAITNIIIADQCTDYSKKASQAIIDYEKYTNQGEMLKSVQAIERLKKYSGEAVTYCGKKPEHDKLFWQNLTYLKQAKKFLGEEI